MEDKESRRKGMYLKMILNDAENKLNFREFKTFVEMSKKIYKTNKGKGE